MNTRPQTPALTPQSWISLFLSRRGQFYSNCLQHAGGKGRVIAQLLPIYPSICAFVFVQMIVHDELWEKKKKVHVTDKNIVRLQQDGDTVIKQ